MDNKEFLAAHKLDLQNVKRHILDGNIEKAQVAADEALAKLEERLKSIEGV